ncbi:putative membrane protein [Oxalobacteraceae bacterium GrIS 1.11]
MSQETIILDHQLQSAKNLAWTLYLIHAVSFLFSLGALSFIPLIINYIKRPETAGTFVYSHHTWQIRSFWWYLLWVVVGAALFVTFIGIPLAWLVWACAWLWKAYRLLKGWLDLHANRAMPV